MIAEKNLGMSTSRVTYAKGSAVSLIIRGSPFSCDVHFRLQRESLVYILSVWIQLTLWGVPFVKQ